MFDLTTATMFILLIAGILLVRWWAQSPYHHRGLRRGEFPRGFKNLLRDADGSRMAVEDERTLRSVEVEKVYSDKHEVLFALRVAVSGADETSVLRKALEDDPHGASLQIGEGSLMVTVQCERPTEAAPACRVLWLMLEALGSNAASSFHIYFVAKPDIEASRVRYEEIVSDPDASAFRKDVAAGVLKEMDRRLEQKKRPD